MASTTSMPNAKLPTDMDDFLTMGIKVLDHGGSIPKKLVKACAGILLIEAGEAGLVVSCQGGNGLALAHRDGKWSNPVAVNIWTMGGGAVFGYANKSVIVLLNRFALDRVLEGDSSISIGVDTGFALGKTGRAASADIELSNKGGLASSLIYTYSEGMLISLQAVVGARVRPPSEPNKNFYNTSNYADILDGKVEVPEGSQVPVLWEKLDALENGPEVEEEED